MSDIKVPEGYKQTEIGVIPEDWDLLSVREICDLLTGFPFPSSKYQDSGIRLLRGSNVKRGNTDWDENITRFWSESTSGIEQYLLQKDDVVISMDGSLVGRSFAQLSDSDLPSLLLQRVARLRARVVSQNYLKEWICSPIFSDYCDSVKTVTAIPHISPADILNFRLLIPKNKKEQTAIATALSDVDNLIGSLEKLIAKKEAIKTGTMQQLLTGKTRLPEFATHDDGSPKGFKQTELGRIPEDWEVSSLGDLSVQIKSGKNIKDKSGIYPLYGSTGQIGKCKIPSYNQEAILVARVGANAGRVNFVDGKYGVSDNTIIINTNSDNSIQFIKSWLVQKDLNTLVFGSGQPLITGTQLKNLLILSPSKNEQTAIATTLSDMDAEIQTLQQRLAKTKDIKQGMMQQLLTGKVRLAY
ncbi:restriction endonuclease subunit S [Psychrobacter immobilis]|uniref:restriction endonuclease subunit S n=1 Tax=Psychrobacter immobilis TaxID=498 RepID=UPI001919C772|nr:restriction endonuclease subunit S [Psychrobacter immobilis]